MAGNPTVTRLNTSQRGFRPVRGNMTNSKPGPPPGGRVNKNRKIYRTRIWPLIQGAMTPRGRGVKFVIVALTLAAAGSTATSAPSPYVGNEYYEIKSLSPDEVSGLLQGSGMGFARAAELNQHPGPRHVLDLAEQLALSDRQVAETNRVFERMHEQAVYYGARLVEYERELDNLFSSGRVSAPALDSLLLKIGETRARVRGVHLHAHLEMKKILSRHQVMTYDKLRGYSNGIENHKHGH